MIPITIRQFPNLVRELVARARVLRSPERGRPTFHLCFFSCQSYFKYLYCSLHSLKENVRTADYKVIVFSDEEQPLSGEQCTAIEALLPGTRVVPWPKSMGWGATQIGWIWRAYALTAEGAADDDIIARIDSDVFFFNDTIFRAVAKSDAMLVGDGHYVDFEYCQGGCYFLRAGAVRRIVEMLEREPLEQVLSEVGITVEDVAVHHFARRLGMKVWLTWFMMFPDELRNSGGLGSLARLKFSCVHFVMKNKAAMLSAYEREMFGGRAPEVFRRALEIN